MGNTELAIGSKGMELASYREAAEFSAMVAKSGLAPKGLETPEKVFVAVAMGAELGMGPMMALQAIGVINGRAGIYGDALIGLVRASGLLEEFEERFEIGRAHV